MFKSTGKASKGMYLGSDDDDDSNNSFDDDDNDASEKEVRHSIWACVESSCF